MRCSKVRVALAKVNADALSPRAASAQFVHSASYRYRTTARSLRLERFLSMSKHAAVWLDHKEARVFAIKSEKIDEEILLAPHHVQRKHPGGPEGAKDHPEDAKRFFHEVARVLDASEQILVLGPSTAKLEFIKYVHKHDHSLEPKVVGVETVDHPTDGQIVAYAKKYFERVDLLK